MSTLSATTDDLNEPLSDHIGKGKIWSSAERILFRIAFLFYTLLIVPLEPEWYGKLFHVKSFYELINLPTGYRVNFITLKSESGRWGFLSFSNWFIALLAAVILGLIWSFFVRNSQRKSYNSLYYWLRVLVRYRIAIGIIAFGFLKVFPMQMPYPSLSNLEANFGDYSTYKIYWQSVGVVTWYEIFLGLLEVAAGALMFFRGTTALGAVINAGVLYNIAHANLAYDGGVHVYSGYFVLLSAFLLVYYIPDLWKLLIAGETVEPDNYYPKLNTQVKKYLYYGVKTLIVFLFIFVYGYYRYDLHYNQGRLKEPVAKGLKDAAGYYNVTEFRLNNKILPYSPLDSVRWHYAIFETYSTLIYKVCKPYSISLENGTPREKDLDRSYELAGIAGGHRFLYYQTDPSHQHLVLQDKNIKSSEGNERSERKKAEQQDAKKKKSDLKKAIPKLNWTVARPTKDRIIISGLNDQKDSIYVVLDRVEKKYPIQLYRADLSRQQLAKVGYNLP